MLQDIFYLQILKTISSSVSYRNTIINAEEKKIRLNYNEDSRHGSVGWGGGRVEEITIIYSKDCTDSAATDE